MTAAADRAVAVLGRDVWTTFGRGSAAQARGLAQGGHAPAVFEAEGVPAVGPCRAHLLGQTGEGVSLLETMAQTVASALRESGLDASERHDCGIFVGSSSSSVAEAELAFAEVLHDPAAVPLTAAGGHGRFADDLSLRFGLNGPRFYFGTACSSSANALIQAMRLIADGELRHAVVVGVERFNWLSLLGFDSLMLLAAEGARPFDRNRDGLALGEGVGAVVIGVSPSGGGWQVRGGASNVDTDTPTNASPASIAEAMAGALDAAGVGPDQVTAIKAHGTGTPSNDSAEAAGLRTLFSHRMPPMSSPKGALGHTMGACGVVEIVSVMACVDQGFWPRSAGFREEDPELAVRPLTAPMNLRHGTFLMNFFGFGGNNAACVIQRHDD